MKPIIHSKKHYVQTSLTTVAASGSTTITLIDAVAAPDLNAVQEVIEGASVKAVFIELWVIGTAGTATQITVLAKLPGGLGVFTLAELAAMGTADNKKNVLYMTQGLASNDGIAGPIPILRQWFKIPKSKQRFGLGDALVLQVFAQAAESLSICGMATYKEYT